jgi:hypothetical protein
MIVSFLLLSCGLFLNDFIGYSLLVNINLAETIILSLQAILFYIFSKKASDCGNSYIVNGILVTLSLIVIFQFRRLGARLVEQRKYKGGQKIHWRTDNTWEER